MNQRGFTIVEIMMVIGIMGILLTVATVQFSTYTRKAAVESQTRVLYSDLMEVRNKALFEKSNRLLKLQSATSYVIYGDSGTTVLETKPLKVPIIWTNSGDILFDTRGMLQNVDNKTICISDENGSPVDSIVISATRIRIGKLDEGASCNASNVTSK